MRNAEKRGVHHYDGTYKLSRNGFIVVVWDEQWFQKPFSNWQIFHRPSGWASANSPTESFNSTLIREFFKG